MIISHPSYDLVNQAVRQIIQDMDKEDFRAELIIGLARGGLVPAVILSQSLNIPMMAVHYSSKKGRGDDRNHENTLPDIKDKRVLIIDDICDSGHTMFEVYDHFTVENDVRTAVLYHKETSTYEPDYFWHLLPGDAPFIVFPWERNVKYLNL